MAKVLSIALRKGGSGKTTTAVNLATALQLEGKRTLLIDLDPQANATMSVGINPSEVEVSINTLLTNATTPTNEAIHTTSFGLDVIPSVEALAKTEMGMTATSTGVLKPIIEELNDNYDFIIIDTPPSQSYLTTSALFVSNGVIIPLQGHYLALQGLQQVIDDIGALRVGLNPKLKIEGILPVMINTNTNIAKTVLDEAKNKYGDLLYPIEVKYSVKHTEATLVGLPTVIYAKEQAQEYIKLAREVIKQNG